MRVKTINTKKTDGTETYQQDRIYDTSGISPALARDKSDINIIQLGNIARSDGWGNPQYGRIYDISGIAPTLNTCGGGGHEPKVLVKNATKQGFSEVRNGGGDEYSVSRQQNEKGACY